MGAINSYLYVCKTGGGAFRCIQILESDTGAETGSDKYVKVHDEQFYGKYKRLNRGYIKYPFMSFSDLELSF